MNVTFYHLQDECSFLSPAGSPCKSAPLFGSVPLASSSPGDAGHGDAGHGHSHGDGGHGHGHGEDHGGVGHGGGSEG